jgi:hypothetical protein
MIAASANWTNETSQGFRLSLDDLLPPSSRQELISTLPGIAPPSSVAPYSAPCSSRPMAETQTYSGPISSQAFPSEPLAPEGLLEERTDWCVDLGSVLASMDTFELWEAIDRGHVRAEMRVWREGMECWTPIGQVSELTLALLSASSRTPEPVSFDADSADSAPPLALMAPPVPLAPLAPMGTLALMAPMAPPALMAPMAPLAPLALRAFEPAFTPPPEEVRPVLETLVSGPQQSGWERISQKILPPPSRKRARAHFWVALGSAIAATAITAAVISAEPPRAGIVGDDYAAAAPPSAPSIGAVAPAPTPALEAAPAPRAPEPAAATVAPPPPVTAAKAFVPPPSAPRSIGPRLRHEERGQHRLRRSASRPYGR